jgi:DNA ligase-1
MAGGVDGLREHCKLTPGVPLKPMLAKPTKAITEVLDRFEGKEFTCEYKYDGERAQVHLLENGEIAVFSRNSENMSAKYPDLVEQVPRVSFSFILLQRWELINQSIKEGVKSFVIDAEAVAYDLETKKLLPFQDLSRRKRKDVRTEDITVRVHLFAFDLLYLNGEVWLSLRVTA